MDAAIRYELRGRTKQKARTRAALLAATRELLAEGRSLGNEGADYNLTTNPRALEKLARQAVRYQPEDLERAYELLLRCDREVKTGKRAPEVAVELLVAELASVAG